MLDEDALTFGVWLQHRRIALHLTQKQLGQLASCSAAMIRKIEADERLPSRDVAQHLATALQISGHDLAAFLRFARGELLHDPFTLPEIAAHPPRRLHAPTDVPIPPNALIGRQDEVTKVVALLKQPDVRLVTLTGPGGVGKTRLSIAIATTLRDVFVDGIVFVNLAPISDPALVIATIATALDVKEVAGRSLLVSVQAYLRDRRLLLLLDNFEQVLEGGLVVADLLSAAPWLKVLVTSREVLHIRGEHEMVVQPLRLPKSTVHDMEELTAYDAVRLFIVRAQAVDADFEVTPANASAVAGICMRLDGLPLAIELAAGRIKMLPPAALLQRLTYRLNILTGGPHDLPARQQTLRATIDWSFRLLDACDQLLFKQLAIFTGGCSLVAVEVVCCGVGGQPTGILDGLMRLVDHSLLRQVAGPDGEPRFFMFETIREFARERLADEHEETQLRLRQATYYAMFSSDLTARFEDKHVRFGELVLLVESEYDNVSALFQWATDAGAIATVVQTAVTYADLWHHIGSFNEGRRWLTRLLGADTSLAQEQRAPLLRMAAVFAERQEDYEAARILYTQCLQAYQHTDSHRGIAIAHLGLGRIAFAHDDVEAALTHMQHSAELLHTFDGTQHHDRSDREYVLGTLHSMLVSLPAASHIVMPDVLAMLQANTSMPEQPWVLIEYGIAQLFQRDLAGAVQMFTDAENLARKLHDLKGLAAALSNLGETLRHWHRETEAAVALEESIDIVRHTHLAVGLAINLTNMGFVELACGRLDAAAVRFDESLALNERLAIASLTCETLAGVAALVVEHGRYDDAARLLGAAEELVTAHRSHPSGGSAAKLNPYVLDDIAMIRQRVVVRVGEAQFVRVARQGTMLRLDEATGLARALIKMS